LVRWSTNAGGPRGPGQNFASANDDAVDGVEAPDATPLVGAPLRAAEDADVLVVDVPADVADFLLPLLTKLGALSELRDAAILADNTSGSIFMVSSAREGGAE